MLKLFAVIGVVLLSVSAYADDLYRIKYEEAVACDDKNIAANVNEHRNSGTFTAKDRNDWDKGHCKSWVTMAGPEGLKDQLPFKVLHVETVNMPEGLRKVAYCICPTSKPVSYFYVMQSDIEKVPRGISNKANGENGKDEVFSDLGLYHGKEKLRFWPMTCKDQAITPEMSYLDKSRKDKNSDPPLWRRGLLPSVESDGGYNGVISHFRCFPINPKVIFEIIRFETFAHSTLVVQRVAYCSIRNAEPWLQPIYFYVMESDIEPAKGKPKYPISITGKY